MQISSIIQQDTYLDYFSILLKTLQSQIALE